MNEMVDILAKMSNNEYSHHMDMTIRKGSLLPDSGETNLHRKPLPSLGRLYLQDVQAKDEPWGPPIAYSTHKTSINQAVPLDVLGERVHNHSDALDQICGLVGEMVYDTNPAMECPWSDFMGTLGRTTIEKAHGVYQTIGGLRYPPHF